MRNNKSLLVAVAVFVCLAYASPSLAQDVWVYPEQWTEPSGDHYHGLGRYVVETSYYFDPIWAAGSIHSPSNRLAGYNQNNGSGSVTVDLSLCGENDVYEGDEGDYSVDIEFQLGGEVPQSGGWAMQKFGSARFAYILSFIHWYGVAHYVRCNPGSQCREMDVIKAAIDDPNPPATYPFVPVHEAHLGKSERLRWLRGGLNPGVHRGCLSWNLVEHAIRSDDDAHNWVREQALRTTASVRDACS